MQFVSSKIIICRFAYKDTNDHRHPRVVNATKGAQSRHLTYFGPVLNYLQIEGILLI